MADFIYVYDRINVVLFLFAALLIFNIKTEKRKLWYLPFFGICAAASVAHYFLYFQITAAGGLLIQMVTSVVLFCLGIGTSVLCFKSSFADISFRMVSAWTVHRLCYVLPILLAQSFTAFIVRFDIDFLTWGYWLYKLSVVAVILFLSYFFIVRRIKKPFDFPRVTPWLLAAMCIIEIFVRVLFAYFYEVYGISNEFKLIEAFSETFVYGFSLAFTLVAFRALSVQKESDGINRLLAAKEDYYKISKSNMDAINIKCHDLKHQLAALRSGVGLESFDASLLDMEKSVMIYDSIAKTGNEPLDVLLTEKSILCDNNGIKLTYMADSVALEFMDAMDIYSMFGNALDNAMESVMKLPGDSSKVITMSVSMHGGFLNIRIENSCPGDVTVKEGGHITTTKKDKSQHGFGIKSIKKIAEKYGGNISIEAGSGIFNLTIVIPVP